jgi:hypothetical protein
MKSVVDEFLKLDHPLARKAASLHEQANQTGEYNYKVIEDWKTANPKEALELKNFVNEFERKFKEEQNDT